MSIKELIHILIPKIITDFHPNLNLSIYYFYVQAMPLLHSIERNYQSRTIEVVKIGKQPKKKGMEIELKRVIKNYYTRGLRVT